MCLFASDSGWTSLAFPVFQYENHVSSFALSHGYVYLLFTLFFFLHILVSMYIVNHWCLLVYFSTVFEYSVSVHSLMTPLFIHFLCHPGRKVGKSGACGQLSRLLDDNPDDSENVPPPCPFRVRATKHRSTGCISITICDLRHSCPQYKHTWRASAHDSGWLAVTMSNRVVQNIKVCLPSLPTCILTLYIMVLVG